MKNSFSTNFLLFTGFLVIGYLVSYYFFPYGNFGSARAASVSLTGSYTPIQVMKNGQRIFLLVGVDSLDPRTAQLKSLWLATYMPSDPSIRLLPILPSKEGINQYIDHPLNRAFELNGGNGRVILDNRFINYLKENNYWWSGYIVFDETILQKTYLSLNDQSGSYKVVTAAQKSPTNLNEISTQVLILQAACQKLSNKLTNPDWSEIESLIPAHILTDLDIQQISSEWENTLASGRGINCIFPTMMGTSQ